MHDLKANLDKILPIVNTTLCDQLATRGNLQSYPRNPRLPNVHIITLALLQEALGIDSEGWFWSKIQTDYHTDFSGLPHLTNYNRRRKRLAGWIEQLARRPDEDTFVMDSIPVPVAHIACPYSTRGYREHFNSAPDKGCSAVFDQFYIGYKLHLVISLDGA